MSNHPTVKPFTGTSEAALSILCRVECVDGKIVRCIPIHDVRIMEQEVAGRKTVFASSKSQS